jgi:hypothetical protein
LISWHCRTNVSRSTCRVDGSWSALEFDALLSQEPQACL